MKLRIAGTVNESIVDGPGFRYTIFTQGCPHHCEGCHNPQTHDFNGGTLVDTDDLFNEIIKDKFLDGVTFSGGDPFCQCKPLTELAKKIRSYNGFITPLNIISYTGYSYTTLATSIYDTTVYSTSKSAIIPSGGLYFIEYAFYWSPGGNWETHYFN